MSIFSFLKKKTINPDETCYCLNCGKAFKKYGFRIYSKIVYKKFCCLKCRQEYNKKTGRQKLWDKNYRQSHKAIILQRKREWRKKNPEKWKAIKKLYRKLHPEKKSKNKGVSKEAFEKIKQAYGYKCAICGKKEPFLGQYWPYLTQDHIIPRSKGGKKRAKSNIQPLCWNCNLKKQDKIL